MDPIQVTWLTNPGDWAIILKNWNTLIRAFFQALNTTFGKAIEEWWFEVWNEPDSPFFWIPDTQESNAPSPAWPASSQPPLHYYCELYQETVEAISAAISVSRYKWVGQPLWPTPMA